MRKKKNVKHKKGKGNREFLTDGESKINPNQGLVTSSDGSLSCMGTNTVAHKLGGMKTPKIRENCQKEGCTEVISATLVTTSLLSLAQLPIQSSITIARLEAGSSTALCLTTTNHKQLRHSSN